MPLLAKAALNPQEAPDSSSCDAKGPEAKDKSDKCYAFSCLSTWLADPQRFHSSRCVEASTKTPAFEAVSPLAGSAHRDPDKAQLSCQPHQFLCSLPDVIKSLPGPPMCIYDRTATSGPSGGKTSRPGTPSLLHRMEVVDNVGSVRPFISARAYTCQDEPPTTFPNLHIRHSPLDILYIGTQHSQITWECLLHLLRVNVLGFRV